MDFQDGLEFLDTAVLEYQDILVFQGIQVQELADILANQAILDIMVKLVTMALEELVVIQELVDTAVQAYQDLADFLDLVE